MHWLTRFDFALKIKEQEMNKILNRYRKCEIDNEHLNYFNIALQNDLFVMI